MSETKVPDYLLAANQRNTPENIHLFESALRGDLGAVTQLLKQGAKPNFFHRPEDQKNALHVAAERDFVEIAEILLQHGAVVDAIAATDQTTALVLAARSSSVRMITLLLSHHAHLEHSNGYGHTALHEAVQGGNLPVVRLLLERGADVHARNHKGSTCLHLLCYHSQRDTHSIEIAELLLRAGADVHVEDRHRLTAALVCCMSGREDLLYELLRHGARIEGVKDDHGRDARSLATFYRHEELLRVLDAHGRGSHK